MLNIHGPVNDSNRRHIIGVDIGSSTLAPVTVFDSQSGKVVKQLYFGRDVAVRQRKYEKRRAKLQSYADKGSEKAKKKYLKRHKRKQRNFVKTRSGQIAKEIVELALKYNASVAVEKLRFRAVKGKINKNGRKRLTAYLMFSSENFLKATVSSIIPELIIPLNYAMFLQPFLEQIYSLKTFNTLSLGVSVALKYRI